MLISYLCKINEALKHYRMHIHQLIKNSKLWIKLIYLQVRGPAFTVCYGGLVIGHICGNLE